jgi:hypothetical protein
MTTLPSDLRCGSCAYREHRIDYDSPDLTVYRMSCMHPTGNGRTCEQVRHDDAACGVTAKHWVMRYEPSHFVTRRNWA